MAGKTGTAFKNDMTLAAQEMDMSIPEITEDEKMKTRLLAAAYVSPEQGLARVLDMLGIGVMALGNKTGQERMA